MNVNDGFIICCTQATSASPTTLRMPKRGSHNEKPVANPWSDPNSLSLCLTSATKTLGTRCFGVSYVKCKKEGTQYNSEIRIDEIINQVMLRCLFCQVKNLHGNSCVSNLCGISDYFFSQ